jgi:hypothetical protein
MMGKGMTRSWETLSGGELIVRDTGAKCHNDDAARFQVFPELVWEMGVNME